MSVTPALAQAESISADQAHKPEQTFRSYTAAQAEAYNRGRLGPKPELIKEVVDYHSSGGGAFEQLVDLGCGPGNSTRVLAAAFNEAVGIDPSPSMVAVARENGGLTKSGEAVKYVDGAAEECDVIAGFDSESVDMITASVAAHWFDMPKFWPAAARALRPGGTVAFWTGASAYVHPSHKNAAKMQEHLSNLEDVILEPYNAPGNRMTRAGYETMPLPWDMPADNPSKVAFDRDAFVRKDWNREGKCAVDEDFFGGTDAYPLDLIEQGFGTASSVTRWREANPDLAGTDKDCVRQTFAAVKPLLGEPYILKTGQWTVLLLLRKRAS